MPGSHHDEHDQEHGHDDQEHGHGHHHDGVLHTHAPVGRMRTAFFLTLLILAVEVTGGFISNSLALLSDAGHVLTDIAAISLSWYALRQSQKPPNERMTFGYHRTGILAALINAVSLIVIAIVIASEAYHRFAHPEPVHSTAMFLSAGVGLAVNLYLGLGLRGSDDINVKSAVLHMLGDAAASAGVIVGALVILLTGWYEIDPLLSVLIALLIASGAWRVLQQTVAILLESTPKGMELPRIADLMAGTPGVVGVHDLHIWSLTAGRHALSCHVVLNGNPTLNETQAIIHAIEHRLLHENIGHATIQPEDIHHLHDTSLLCCDNGTSIPTPNLATSEQGHAHP